MDLIIKSNKAISFFRIKIETACTNDNFYKEKIYFNDEEYLPEISTCAHSIDCQYKKKYFS